MVLFHTVLLVLQVLLVLSVELVLLVAIINYCCIFSVSELPSLLLDSGDTLHVSICIFLYLIILCLE